MNDRRMIFWALLLVLLGCPALAQTVHVYPPFVPTPEYLRAADKLVLTGSREAREEMFAIARSHPGTTLAAHCLFVAAFYSGNEASKPIYQEIMRTFPYSRFDIVARHSYLAATTGLTQEQRLAGVDQILRFFGGPSTAQVVQDRRRAAAQLRALHPEFRQGLNQVYATFVVALGNAGHYDEAIAAAAMCSEVYADDKTAGYDGYVLWFQRLKYGMTEGYRGGRVNPTVVPSKARRMSRGRPQISVVAWTGDYTCMNPDFDQSDFLVDGQDVKSQLIVENSFARKLELGKVWEKVRWTYRPSRPLAPGMHTVTVTVRVGGYKTNHETGPGSTTVTWSFLVQPQGHDDDDDRDDFPCDHDD